MSDIVVLGSLNTDFVLRVQRIPAPGETLHAREFHTFPGGKGANQAAAISRLGISASLVGRVGQDAYGEELLQNLAKQGVDTSMVVLDPESQTGLAFILLDGSGENRIMLISGANTRVDTSDVNRAEEKIHRSKLLLCQLETFQGAVGYAIEKASAWHVPVLFNPAPAYPLSDEILQKLTYLVMNETEAEIISGLPVNSLETARQAGISLHSRGAKTVIVTLGSQGAMVVSEGVCDMVPGFHVEPVDTTSAGDAFIGGFAAATVRGLPLIDRVRYANACGAITVTRLGAQPSLPDKGEVDEFLRARPSL